MQYTMLNSKLHRGRVTHSVLEYEGSCAIDSSLLEAAGIQEYQQIQIYNLTNGERLTTYAIRAEADSKIISVNGAAAHKANPGDRIIICSYVNLTSKEIAGFSPILVYLDEQNHITHIKKSIPAQVA